MERTFIINVGANTSAAEKAFGKLNAQYEKLQDGIIKVKMIYDYADKDNVFNALKDLSASNPELLVQINYDMQESLLQQKLKELASMKDLMGALGNPDSTALESYVSSMMDQIEAGLKSGLDKSSLSETFMKAMDLDALGYELFGDSWSQKISDRLLDIGDNFSSQISNYEPNIDVLSETFEENLDEEIKNTEKIIEGIKLQLKDFRAKGARSTSDVIDFSNSTKSLDALGAEAESTFKNVEQSADGAKQKTEELNSEIDNTAEKLNGIQNESSLSPLEEVITKVVEKISELSNMDVGQEGSRELSDNFKSTLSYLERIVSLYSNSGALKEMISGWISSDQDMIRTYGKSHLKERSAVVDASGRIWGGYAYGEDDKTKNKHATISRIKESGGTPYANIHSHSSSNFASLSIANTHKDGTIGSDIKSWFSDYKEGIEKELVISLKEAMVFNAKDFFDAHKSIDFSSNKTIESIKTARDELLNSTIGQYKDYFLKEMIGEDSWNNAIEFLTNEISSNTGLKLDANALASSLADGLKTSANFETALDNAIDVQSLGDELAEKVDNYLLEGFDFHSFEQHMLGVNNEAISPQDRHDFALRQLLPEIFNKALGIDDLSNYLQTFKIEDFLNSKNILGISSLGVGGTLFNESDVTSAIQKLLDNLNINNNEATSGASASTSIADAAKQVSEAEATVASQIEEKQQNIQAASDALQQDTSGTIINDVDMNTDVVTQNEGSPLTEVAQQLSESEAELKRQLQLKEQELAEANAKLEESTDQYDSVVHQLHQVQDENRGLADDSDTFLNQIEQLQDEIEAADQRLRENHKFYNEQLGKLQETVDALTRDNNALVEDNNYWQSSSAEWSAEYGNLKAENEELKEQVKAAHYTSEGNGNGSTSTEAESFQSIAESAEKAAAAKELFNEQNIALQGTVPKSNIKLSDEATLFERVSEAGTNAAVAKELFTEANLKVASSVENVIPALEREAKLLDQISKNNAFIPNDTSSDKNTSSGGRTKGVTKADRRSFDKLYERVNGSEYLKDLYGEDVEAMKTAFDNFNPKTDKIDELRDKFKTLKDEVTATTDAVKNEAKRITDGFRELKSGSSDFLKALGGEKNQTDIDAFIEKYQKLKQAAEDFKTQQGEMPASMQKSITSFESSITKYLGQSNGLTSAIDSAMAKSGITEEYKARLEDIKTNLGEVTTFLNTPRKDGELFDFELIKTYIEYIKSAKKELADLSGKEQNLATTGQVDKLIGKVQDSLHYEMPSGLRGEFEQLLTSLQAVREGSDEVSDGFSSISKADFSKLSSQFNNLNSKLKEFGTSARGADRLSAAMAQQSSQLIARYLSFYSIVRYAKQIASSVIEVDSALTELRKVSDESNSRLQQSFAKSAETAQELGATITDVINSTSDWARLGYSIDDAEKLARTTQLYQNVGDNMTQETASQSLISTLKGFQMDASEAESIVDKFNEVANNYAIDTAGIGESLQRSASAFNAAHTSLDKSIALVTATNSVLQNPEQVGTLWNTLSARIRGASTELSDLGEEEDEFTQTTSKLRDLVMQLTGFDIMVDEDTYKDIYDIILGISEKWKDLSDVERASLGEALAGKRNSKGLFAVLDNIDTLEGAYDTARESAGSAAREQEAYAQSVQYSVDRTKASLQELSVNFLSSSVLKGLIDFANELLQIVNKIIDKFGSIGSIATTFLGMDFLKGALTGGQRGLLGPMFADIASSKGGATNSMFKNIAIAFSKPMADAGSEAGTVFVEGMGEAVVRDSGLIVPEGAIVSSATKAGASAGAAGAKAAGAQIAGLSAGAWLGIGAAIAGAIAIGVSAYNAHQKKLLDDAKSAARSWDDEKRSIEESYASVAKLRDELDNNTSLDDSERLEIKKQIYEIQKQITSEYGNQGGAIDLINGDLREQLDLLENISAKEAERNLRENREVYNKLERDMEKNYGGGAIDLLVGTAQSNAGGKQLQSDIQKALEDSGAKVFGTFMNHSNGGLSLSIIDGSSMKEISEDTELFMQQLDVLEKKYKDSGDFGMAENVKSIEDQVYKATAKARKAWEDEKPAYENKLNAEFANAGGLVYERNLKNAMKAFDDAMVSGDSEAINESIEGYKSALSELESFANGIDGFNADQLVESLTSGFDEAALRAYDFQDVIQNGDNRHKDNIFERNAKGIQSLSDEIKNAKIDTVDASLMLQSDKLETSATKTEAMLESLARSFGVMFDGTAEDASKIDSFIKVLSDSGVIFSGVDQEVKKITSSFKSFRDEISGDYSKLDLVNSSLAAAATGKGLNPFGEKDEEGNVSSDVGNITKAFKDLESFHPEDVFRHTANGVKVNEKELRRLQKEQDKVTRKKFLQKQKELTDQLVEAERKRNTETNEEKIRGYENEIATIRQNLMELGQLQTAYEGATSAYQKWLDAQSAGERGDIYDNIRETAVKRADELYKEGLVGTNEFRALAELISGEDLSTASADKVEAAYKQIDAAIEGTSMTLRDFYEEGGQGVDNLIQTLLDLGHATQDGDIVNFKNLNTTELAEQLHTSVDWVEAALEKLNDYGFDITWRTAEQADMLDGIEKKYEKIKSTFEGKSFRGMNLDLNQLDTIEELDHAAESVQYMLDHPMQFSIDDSEAQALYELLGLIEEKRNVLEMPTGGQEFTVENYRQAQSALAEIKSQIHDINESGIADMELSEDAKEAAEWLASLDDEIKMALDIEPTSDSEKLLASLGYNPNGTPTSKPQTPTVAMNVQPQPRQTRQQRENTHAETTINTNVQKEEVHKVEDIKVTADTSQLELAQQAVDAFTAGLPPEEIASRILCEVYGVEDVEELKEVADEAAVDRAVEVVADAVGTGDVREMVRTIGSLSGKSVPVTANVDRSPVENFVSWFRNLRLTTTATINYRTIGNLGAAALGGFDGTAHARGTISGFAYAHGNWGLRHSERALVGELGEELYVDPRDSTWHTIGTNGAEFVDLPKGAIIFNHLQTKELLENGYTHGRAHASGTALANSTSGSGKRSRTKGKSSGGKSSGGKSSGGKSGGKSGGNSNSAKDAAEKAAEDIKDWVEVLLDRVSHTFENFKEMSEYWTSYKNQNREINNAISQAEKNITWNQKAYERYIKQANSVGLNAKYAKQVREGTIDIESIKDEKLKEKVESYTEWWEKARDCADTIRDLNKEVLELSRQKIDNLIEDYESYNELTEKIYTNLQKQNEIYTNSYGDGSTSLLKQMGAKQNALLTEYMQAYDRIQNEVKAQLKNGYMNASSKEYRKAMSDLKELQNLMADVQLEIHEINDSIREINWSSWNEAVAVLEHMNTQLDSTIGILSDLTAYEDNAAITKNGVAQFNLYSSALGNARKEIKDYGVAIDALKNDLKNGFINQKQYNEELRDYTQKQMSAVTSAKKYRDAIISLIKDGIEAETNAFTKLIEKRKEDLKRQKDANDYAKTVAEKQKAITKTQAQLAALSGDSTLATQSKVAKLREQLAQQQQELADTRRDHEYDATVQAYDDELAKFKETQDEKAAALEYSLANQETAIQETLNWTRTQYQDTYGALNQIAMEYGINLESFITNPWKNATNAVNEYKAAVAGVKTSESSTSNTNKVTSTASAKATASVKSTTTVKANTDQKVNSSGAYKESIKAPVVTTTTKKKAAAAKKPAATTKKATTTTKSKKISGSFSGKQLSTGSYNKADTKYLQKLLNAIMGAGLKVDGQYGSVTASAVKKFQKKYGLAVDGIFGPKSRKKLISVAKSKGYARRGKRNAKGLYVTDEEGIGTEAIITKEGVLRQLDSDTVFSRKQTEALWDLSRMNLRSLLDNSAKVVRRDSNVNVNYGSLLTVNGNVDKEALPKLQEILRQACEYTKRDITQTMSKIGMRGVL